MNIRLGFHPLFLASDSEIDVDDVADGSLTERAPT